jgi:hypothetical protein
MARRPTTLIVLGGLLVLAVLLVAVLGGGTWGYFWFRRYVDSDPRFCAHCHKASPDFAIWTAGGHRSVACQRCHHSTPQEGLAMLGAFLAGKPAGGKHGHAPVEVGACASCHLSHDRNWPQIGASRGHRIHVEQQKIACVTCHAGGVHGFRPVSESCKKCHGEHAVRAQGMAKLHCFTCHDFRSDEPGLRPTRDDCLTCHRKEGVHPARFDPGAPMQFECGRCHKPHAATPAESRVACASCHAGVASAGLHRQPGHRRCQECHPAHGWRAAESDCLRCHGGAPRHAEGRACTSCHAFRAPPRGGVRPAGGGGPGRAP